MARPARLTGPAYLLLAACSAGSARPQALPDAAPALGVMPAETVKAAPPALAAGERAPALPAGALAGNGAGQRSTLATLATLAGAVARPQPDAAVGELDAGSAPRPNPASFLIGADVTWTQADEAQGATYMDGAHTELLSALAAHGFNAIRLRTFVDARAADGYDRQAGFGDLAHTIAFARRIRAAGMAFMLDFHYSDNWADPGKLVYALPGERGLGTFNWEPTHEGDWNRGHTLFELSGRAYTATADLSLYDAMRSAYQDRL